MRDLSWPSRSPFTVDALLEFALSSPVSSYVLRGYALPVSRRLCFSLNNGFLSLALLPYTGGTPARALRLCPTLALRLGQRKASRGDPTRDFVCGEMVWNLIFL